MGIVNMICYWTDKHDGKCMLILEHLGSPKAAEEKTTERFLDLGQYVYKSKGKRALTTEWLVKVWLDVAKGLKDLHASQMLHKDLHLGNICVNADNAEPKAKIIDLGACKDLGGYEPTKIFYMFVREATGDILSDLRWHIEMHLKEARILSQEYMSGKDNGEEMLQKIFEKYPNTQTEEEVWRMVLGGRIFPGWIDDFRKSSSHRAGIWMGGGSAGDSGLGSQSGSGQVKCEEVAEHLQTQLETLYKSFSPTKSAKGARIRIAEKRAKA